MEEHSRNFFVRAWNGEEKLWKVWWLVGSPIFILGALLSVWFEDLTIVGTPLARLLPLGFLSVLVAYIAWCNMAWSCAKNVGSNVWTVFAKILIVLGLARTFLNVVEAFPFWIGHVAY